MVLFLACEQALFFGRVKRVSARTRKRAAKPLGPSAKPLCPSAPRPLARAFSRGSLHLPKYQIRELARRLYFFPPTLKSMCIIFSVGKEKSYQQLWRSTEDFSRWHSLNRVVRHNNHSLLSTVLFRAIQPVVMPLHPVYSKPWNQEGRGFLENLRRLCCMQAIAGIAE